jgi:protein phosphatase
VIVQAWGSTDVGKQRSVNEDCYYVDPDIGLMLVLDGMGGHRAGEVASRLAMETVAAFYSGHALKLLRGADLFENYDESLAYQTNLLIQAAYNANRAVLEKSRTSEECAGMGSTLAGLAIHEGSASVINVGDSRMYRIRQGTIEQISRDHTLAEDQVERGLLTRDEARESPLRHILSSVIGVDSRILVYTDELDLRPGDMFLLCTDGLTAALEDEEILGQILLDNPGPDTLSRLIDQANARGGPDNITLALAVLLDGDGPSEE